MEKIVDKLVSADGEAISYKVRWEGYAEEDDTWEEQGNLEQAKKAVQAYEEALRLSQLRGRQRADGSRIFTEPRGRLRS